MMGGEEERGFGALSSASAVIMTECSYGGLVRYWSRKSEWMLRRSVARVDERLNVPQQNFP